MLWLAIHFPLLPLEIFLDNCKPDSSKEKQASIVVQENRGKLIVLVANEQAKQQGITSGMSHSTALALCHEVTIIDRHLTKESNTLQALAETAYEFSSQVVTYSNQRQQHSLLLEISRSMRLFKGIENLKESIHHAFSNHPLGNKQKCASQSSQGFTISIATAKTPRLSEVLARYHSSDENREQNEKKEVSIDFLDCAEHIKTQCHNMGIHSLDKVMQLPRDAMGRRFPKSFILYLNQIDGSLADPLPLFQPNHRFKQSIYFNYGINNQNEIQIPMEKLLKTFAFYLRNRQLQCTQLSWIFINSRKDSIKTTIHFTKPQINIDEMLNLSQIKIGAMDMSSAIEDVQLFSRDFIPMNQATIESLSCTLIPSNDTKQNKIAQLINGDSRTLQSRIQARLGTKSIQTISQGDAHLPEQANQIKNLKRSLIKGIKPGRTLKESYNKDTSIQPRWLISPAKMITVNRVNQFYWLDNRHRLLILKGPNRIYSEWWKKKSARDYYIAGVQARPDEKECSIKSIYWIYQEKDTALWFIHGIF